MSRRPNTALLARVRGLLERYRDLLLGAEDVQVYVGRVDDWPATQRQHVIVTDRSTVARTLVDVDAALAELRADDAARDALEGT